MELSGAIKSSAEREQLLADLATCDVVIDLPDRSIILFQLPGYERPPGHARGSFASLKGDGVEGHVIDRDGARLDVLLHADANRRLYELELVRYEVGPVIGPDWNTLSTK